MTKREPTDWDIVFALMQCYGMLNERGFPFPKKKAKRLARQHKPADRRLDYAKKK